MGIVKEVESPEAHMIRILSVAALLAGTAIFTLPAGAEEDELVRLPSTGTVRDAAVRQRVKADRLRPAGGLFVSFDVTPQILCASLLGAALLGIASCLVPAGAAVRRSVADGIRAID